MPFLIILFIIIAIVSSANKKPQKPPAKPQKPAARQRLQFPGRPAANPGAMPQGTPYAGIFQVEGAEGTSAEDGTCIGGSIPHTEHEGTSAEDGVCIGGSLPHTAHEGMSARGESYTWGSLPMATREGEGKSVSRIVSAATPLEEGIGTTHPRAGFAAADMKRAFVYAEIFAKPVSRRTHGRRI
ncbi:MAG: hypothetical protein ACOYI8_07870 [Christensenellales bacterium]|jgi:hypothetical protein